MKSNAGAPGPLVSIVMPSLNQGMYIGESIRSVLSQSHRDLELIVMDGGSTDDTHDILVELQASDARLCWHSQRDNGPAQALNRALGLARGDVIGWLNSDDLYTPDAIARAVAALAAQPEWLMVYGHGEHIDTAGKYIGDYATRAAETPVSQFAAGCFICQPTVFFRSAMRGTLGPLDEALRTAFDYDYWLRAFTSFQQRIGFVDAVQARSRLHDTCITLTQRRTVALEGMALVAKHLGHAPIHWLLSHVDEVAAGTDPRLGPGQLREYIGALVADASASLGGAAVSDVRTKLLLRAGLSPVDLSPASAAESPYTGCEVRALILLLRDDLREGMQFGHPDRADAFRAWLVGSGLQEYPGLLTDRAFLDDMRAPSRQVDGLTQLQYAVWLARPDVQRSFPLPRQLKAFKAWFAKHGVAEHGLGQLLPPEEQAADDLARPASCDPSDALDWRQRPFGVNLFGHVYSQFGVGEDVRMAARALQAAGVPFTLIDVPPGPGIAQGDRSLEHLVGRDAPYAFNLFCMTAPEHARYRAMHGTGLTQGRYNIGYWPWELSCWPTAWQPLFGLVDEVWSSSTHTLGAVQASSPVPCRLMPMAVELGPVADFGGRRGAREHFGLPQQTYLFCFAFDLSSSIHRKNPQACLEAFQKAFPLGSSTEDVGLVIKTHRPSSPHAEWERLKARAARDPRIRLVEETLARSELLALYQCCDCFLSLHRAEGFGRAVAEAMLLGLRVIVTGYSGNLDFCSPPHTLLVPVRLVDIRPGEYQAGEGLQWADINMAMVVESLRVAVLSNASPCKLGRYSILPVGRHYQYTLKCLNA